MSSSKIVLRVTAFPIMPILSVLLLIIGVIFAIKIHFILLFPFALALLFLVRPVRLIYDRQQQTIGFYHSLFGYAVNEVVKFDPAYCELRLLLKTETERIPMFSNRRNFSMGHIPFFDIKIVDETGVLFELNTFSDYKEARDYLYATAKKIGITPNDVYIQKVQESKAARNNR